MCSVFYLKKSISSYIANRSHLSLILFSGLIYQLVYARLSILAFKPAFGEKSAVFLTLPLTNKFRFAVSLRTHCF